MYVITIGDNNCDTYASGYTYAGGNCTNVAAYAAMNGAHSAYIGVVGKDNYGDLFVRSLQKAGVITDYIRRENGSTSRDVIISDNGDRVFTQYDRSIIDAYPICLSQDEYDEIAKADLIVSSIYSAFKDQTFKNLCSLGVPVAYDFSVEWQTGTSQVLDQDFDTVMANIRENTMENICPMIDYGFFSCGNVTWEETYEVLKKAVSLGCSIAVGTRGIEGSCAYDGKQFYRQSAYPARVIDTLGAGDSFITRFLLSHRSKMTYLKNVLRAVDHSIRESDLNDYKEKAIISSLSDAALFASRSCSLEGAFGFGEIL